MEINSTKKQHENARAQPDRVSMKLSNLRVRLTIYREGCHDKQERQERAMIAWLRVFAETPQRRRVRAIKSLNLN
jgi:hypothetical protein